MKAVTFDSYGGPEMLSVTDQPEPHAGAGQIRIRVMATSVNPVDWKIRQGHLAEHAPVDFPSIIGKDAAGVVDEVGDGVEGIEVGDEVLGLGSGTAAQFAVLDSFGPKPAALTFEEAAGLPLVTETAERTLNMLNVKSGDTVLIEGASGGVGSAAVQLAKSRGATVVGTASSGNHEYLTSLGAIPTTYGDGLAGRLKELGHTKFDAVLDTAGAGSIEQLVALVDDPAQVVSVADFEAPKHGARVSDGSTGAAPEVLGRIAELNESFGYSIPLSATLPLERAGDAHAKSAEGHVRGKIVLVVE